MRTLGRVLQQVTKVILQPRIGKERNDLNDRECERRMNGVIVGKEEKVVVIIDNDRWG